MRFLLKIYIIILVTILLIPAQVFAKTLQGPVLGNVSSLYGLRNHPVYGFTKFHRGLDIAAPYGAPVYAMQDGMVIKSGKQGGLGLAITVDHYYIDLPAIPRIQTMYGHCSALWVEVGQYVRRGQIIAYVGSTGISTGPHLHFQVMYQGKAVDPIDYLEKLPGYLNYIAKARSNSRYTVSQYSK